MSQLTSSRTRPVTVLLIDDDPDIVQIWALVLSFEGMVVITAQNGSDGLAKALQGGADVIVCDYMMPGMDGLAVCRALRSDERTHGLPMILCSAARGIQAESLANVVLEKPLSVETLVEHIRSLSRRPSSH
ncbi:response regulator [Caballeronia sp. LP006]|uniref:response regulator transcription factor n=1 Tax=Caballeronia sp. LP006 TaxID=3038552 RepID=UPI00285F980E|nr:response regulator [Caballeronia sp. LP006]MDR5826253.1 response regulator [Caballeronia sp. LP006]